MLRILINFLTAGIIISCCLSPAAAEKLNVAVAANFLDTAQALSPLLKEMTGIEVKWSAGSSGKLYASIINGAPFDVLLAADAVYPEKLERQGAAVAGTGFCYAMGKLVLYGPENIANEQALRQAYVKRIALANPRVAPYGQAAEQTLRALHLWSVSKNKLVFGENIAQAFQFVVTGNAQLGFVALSQMKAAKVNEQAYWVIPENLYSPLRQVAVLLTASKRRATAEKFLAFLKTKEAQTLIERYGYSVDACTH